MKRFLSRHGGRLAGPLTAATCLLLLYATVLYALAIPSLGVVGALPPLRLLDYAHLTQSLSPLSERYVQQILGLRSSKSAPVGAAAATNKVATSPDPTGPATGISVTHPFTNDAFNHAYPIRALPFTAHTDTRGETRQPGEPNDCGRTGGTAWYGLVPTSSLAVFSDTFGSGYPLTLGVYEGTSLGQLRQVGCNVGANGNAQVGFYAERGHHYYFQVTGIAYGGPLAFSVSPVGTLERVSHNADGSPAGGAVTSVSRDGRYVAFNGALDTASSAQHPCEDGSNPKTCTEVFLYDRATRRTELISRSKDGTPANGGSSAGSLSADARYVSYYSSATNLSPLVKVPWNEVYVYDRLTQQTEIESVTEAGAAATPRASNPTPPQGPNGSSSGSLTPTLSGDGRFVLFSSDAESLAPGQPSTTDCVKTTSTAPNNGQCFQVFVRDRLTRRTALVSVDAHGAPIQESFTGGHSLSEDGRYAAFTGFDSDGVDQAYVRDLRRRTTVMVSVSSRGIAGNGNTGDSGGGVVVVSDDGRFAAFPSNASNLVSNDTNAGPDVFVRDLVKHVTQRVSVSSSGEQQALPPPNTSVPYELSTDMYPTISGDGRYVAFDSWADNLVPNDTNHYGDCFVHDRRTGATVRVSVNWAGQELPNGGFEPIISGDGRVVGFGATDPVAPGENNTNTTAGAGERAYVHVLPAQL